MRKGLVFVTGAAVLAVALLAVFMFKTVTPVSAQTILGRATAAQSAAEAAKGIWYNRIEDYENPLALDGDQAGTTTIIEDYADAQSGFNRRVTSDASGKLLDVSSFDGNFYYWSDPSIAGSNDGNMLVYRIPPTPDDVTKQRVMNTEVSANSIFEQFRSNPRVELLGKETREDGRQVYVLIDRNFQTQSSADGKTIQVPTGATQMTFDAQTYQLLESQTTVQRDGKEIVLERVRFLVEEVLPAGSEVAWDLSDLQGISIVDQQPVVEQVEALPVPITQDELAKHNNVYVLKDIPEGFTQEIVAAPNQPEDQPYTYEVNYNNAAKENFGLMAIGVNNPGFVESAFYDGSYKTSAGMVLNYSSSRPDGDPAGTSAMLTMPDGISFLLTSTMSREQVQALVEDLVRLK